MTCDFCDLYGPLGPAGHGNPLFTKAIVEGTPIPLFNHGKMRKRDFTYVDDVAHGILRLIDHVPESTAERAGGAPKQIPRDIGNKQPEELIAMSWRCSKRNSAAPRQSSRMLPMQPGDVLATYADIDDLTRDVGFLGRRLRSGTVFGRFVAWYRDHYRI